MSREAPSFIIGGSARLAVASRGNFVPEDGTKEAVMAQKRCFPMTVAATLCGMLAVGAATAGAQVVLDQSFTDPHYYHLGAEFYGHYNAQTFTAGVTGMLVGVKVDVSLWQDDLPLRVAVRSVSDGVPTNTVLTEMTLPPGEPAAGIDTYIELEKPFTVVAGTQYALVLNFVGAGEWENSGMWTGGTDFWYGTDFYPGGEWFFSLDGIDFEPYHWNDHADVHFQTYVDVTPDVRETIEEFIDDLHELIAEGEIAYGRGRGLIAELQVALWFLKYNGGESLAAVRLEIFIIKVELMLDRGEVEAALGEELLLRARAILQLLRSSD